MRFDAVILGAGPAGSAAAIALASKGWSVALVEKAVFPRRKVCGEFVSATTLPILERLGVGEAWRARAGPPVRRVALYAGKRMVEAPMPDGQGLGFGRALGRDVLDDLLLRRAGEAGATIFQPWRAVSLVSDGDEQRVVLRSKGGGEAELPTPVVIAAHGSWEPGALPSNLDTPHSPHDFLGFKAHFRGAEMADDLMPLLAFPGGYGGMVWSDEGRLSLSCCVRRDHLARIRANSAASCAGEAVQAHLVSHSAGIRRALAKAGLCGPWLAAGPIRPGIRSRYEGDVFRVGNVAGEAHPVIAEGISMAIQSATLLAATLDPTGSRRREGRQEAGRRYAAAWAAQFSGRIRAASVFAHLAAQPGTAGIAGAAIERLPHVLTWGARLSGKTTPLRVRAPDTSDLREAAH